MMDPKLEQALKNLDPAWLGKKPLISLPLKIKPADGRNPVDPELAALEHTLGMAGVTMENIETYLFLGGWGDGWTLMRTPARITLEQVENGHVFFMAGWAPSGFSGGWFRLEDLAKVRALTIEEEATRQLEQTLTGYHIIFEQKPGVTGVVVVALTPEGERFGVAHGGTLEWALSDLRVRVLSSMMTMAKAGENPLSVLGQGSATGHPSAVLLGHELAPSVLRFRRSQDPNEDSLYRLIE